MDLFHFALKILEKILPQGLKSTNEDHQVHFDDIGFPEVDLGVSKNIKNTGVWNCIYNHVGPGGIGSQTADNRAEPKGIAPIILGVFLKEVQRDLVYIFFDNN